MERKQLPRLELDGFVTRQYIKPKLWERAAGVLTGAKRGKETGDDMDIAYKRLLAKTGVCAAVAVTILVISSLSTPASAELGRAVDYVVNHEFDVDEDIGRLKFVEALDDTQSVFRVMTGSSVVFPSDGEVVTAFGEGGSAGVRMSTASPDILSIAKGTVTGAGNISGEGYVKVTLDSGETVVYYNLVPCVQADDIVMPGQLIGKTEEGYLYVEMKAGDTYIDPIAYISSHADAALE